MRQRNIHDSRVEHFHERRKHHSRGDDPRIDLRRGVVRHFTLTY